METPLRILSLDGGGVRGISSLYILKELMAQIARQHRFDHPDSPNLSPRPCDYFDLICGTSTGGLIALMLGRLRMASFPFLLLLLTHYSLSTKLSKTTKPSLKKFLQANQKSQSPPSTRTCSSRK
ncbi:MAG: hypothetical protein E6J34_17650 [Chloroflexi bacterium]|nr:MAG: hypothetical protein E6J34_17650 [Chloroflexota bacterium]